MSQLLAALKLDIKLQARSKLYAVGIAVAMMLGLLGRCFVHPDYAGRLLAVFYLTGLGGTTYMFSAAVVLLEKSDGTLQALRTTPLTSTTYIASKVITLTTFAAMESAIVYVVAFFGVPLNVVPMIVGIVCLGMFLTLVGLGQVATQDSVTAFLFPGAVLVSAVLQMPMLYLVDPLILPCYLLPTHGPLLLMLGATESLHTWQWAYAIMVSLVSTALAFLWTKNRFAEFIGLQEGSR